MSTTLTVAAHAGAGGMVPSAGGLLLTTVLGLTLGAGATTPALLRAGTPALAGLLALGQVLGHLVLGIGAADDARGGMTMEGHLTSTMLTAHAVAVVLAVVLVSLADRVGPRCAAALRRVVPAAPGPLVVPARRVPRPVGPARQPWVEVLLPRVHGRRGPPVGA